MDAHPFWIQWLVLVVGISPIPIYFFKEPHKAKVLFYDLRVPRIAYFGLLGLLGMSIYVHGRGENGLEWLLTHALPVSVTFAVFLLCLTYAALFAIVVNNDADIEIDRISNPDRPLVTGQFPRSSYLRLGFVSLAISLVLSWAFAEEMLIGIAGISLGYWAYSAPPLRLKRFPFLAKFIIALNGWTVTICGYALMGGEWAAFPWPWSLFVLVPIGLAANFIDLKDHEGDAHAGVKTLPVLFGRMTALVVISVGTLSAYVMGAWLTGIPFQWLLSLIPGGIHLYFLWRRPYQESPVFILLLFSLASLVISLLFASKLNLWFS